MVKIGTKLLSHAIERLYPQIISSYQLSNSRTKNGVTYATLQLYLNPIEIVIATALVNVRMQYLAYKLGFVASEETNALGFHRLILSNYWPEFITVPVKFSSHASKNLRCHLKPVMDEVRQMTSNIASTMTEVHSSARPVPSSYTQVPPEMWMLPLGNRLTLVDSYTQRHSGTLHLTDSLFLDERIIIESADETALKLPRTKSQFSRNFQIS